MPLVRFEASQLYLFDVLKLQATPTRTECKLCRSRLLGSGMDRVMLLCIAGYIAFPGSLWHPLMSSTVLF